MEGGTYPRGPIMPMGSFLVSKKNQILEGTEGSLTKVQKIITSTKMKDNFYLISHFFSSQKTVFLSKLNVFSRIVGICVSPPMCCSYKIEATGQGRRPITGDGREKRRKRMPRAILSSSRHRRRKTSCFVPHRKSSPTSWKALIFRQYFRMYIRKSFYCIFQLSP